MTYRPSQNSSKLTVSIEFLQLVFSWLETINDDLAFIIWNEHKKIVYVSNTVEHLINLEANELYGNKWRSVFTNGILTNINQFFKRNDQDASNYNFEDNHIDYTLTTIKVKHEQYYFCQLKDNSVINTLNSKVNDLQKGMIHTEKMAITGEFSAGLIHEIRNPLTSLKGFLQLVQAGIEQKEEYYRVMIDEIEKIESITAELLTISKPFSDVKETVSIKEMIDETVMIMKLQSEYRHVLFDVNCLKNITIKCNKQQIKQVLINLFKNASEAMDMNGTVIVNVFEEINSVEIEIIDEGEGISDETIFEIDQAFYTTKETGTGLGLVVTKHILDYHHASMKISSEKGEGSKFKISFPSE